MPKGTKLNWYIGKMPFKTVRDPRSDTITFTGNNKLRKGQKKKEIEGIHLSPYVPTKMECASLSCAYKLLDSGGFWRNRVSQVSIGHTKNSVALSLPSSVLTHLSLRTIAFLIYVSFMCIFWIYWHLKYLFSCFINSGILSLSDCLVCSSLVDCLLVFRQRRKDQNFLALLWDDLNIF